MSSDLHFMRLALELASQASNATSPNPKVGCVLVKDGKPIGRGFTQPAGQAHGEVQALRDAASQGIRPHGATAYVTLEPCSHFGKTPPCANALIEAGVARVVVAIEDPNPLVAGRGLALLRAAGIEVECGLLAQESRELNIGFFKRMETGKPWVRMKVAASLDGRTALPNGHSQWISVADARLDGHRWRARSDAILTGIGTVLADDPQMTVRGVELARQPQKIVLDSQLRLPLQAKLLDDGTTIAVYASAASEALNALVARGVECLPMPATDGRIDLSALMLELGRRQVNELHVEAGAKLNGALLAQNCVDEIVLYLAPKLLGSGAGLFDLPELTDVNLAQKIRFHEITQIGETARMICRFD